LAPSWVKVGSTPAV
jgi:hypothetical protein